MFLCKITAAPLFVGRYILILYKEGYKENVVTGGGISGARGAPYSDGVEDTIWPGWMRVGPASLATHVVINLALESSIRHYHD